MKIGLSVTVLSIGAVVAVNDISVAVARPSYIEAVAVASPKLIFSPSEQPEVLEQTNLVSESVFISDIDGDQETVFELDLVKGTANAAEVDQAEPEDSDPVFEADKVLADSVTVVETRVKVFTDFIDFDPSDADIDATPVTIAESDAKDITVGELADNDEVTIAESAAKESNTSRADAVTTSEAIDDFDIGKNPSDTATASEAIDRFDVATAFDDTVSVTEALENEVTLPVADSVTAVQSNIKTFTSNVDFDLSDADVDPDPVTAADVISEFDFNKGLTDAATATEADAKEVTVGELADSDTTSLSDSDAKEFTHGGLSDSLTAVEGIKNNPEIAKSDSVTTSEAQVFDARPELSDSATLAEAIDNFDVDLVKADAVNVSDVSVKNFTENVDFDRSDADADADPVNVSEQLATDTTKPLTDSFSLSEAAVINYTAIYTDTATATESINTLLTLGDSEFVYPDFVSVSDGYRRFIEEPYSYTISSTDYFVPLTGVIGAAETINTVMLAANRVTVPDTSSAGLLVNFHYTDVNEDDRALGGYYFNQTPINAGNSTVGARTIL
jgi:hypothetical protein